MNFAYRILSALGWIWLIAAGIFLYIRLRSPKTPPPPGGQTQA